jgi:DNA-binding ferritin-like protein
MSHDNVLSLNAFGELIVPNGKREYKQEDPIGPSPSGADDRVEIIPLARVSPGEKQVPSPVSTDKEGRYCRGSQQSNQIVCKVLAHMAQTKLLHWQTESLAEHKSLDKLFKVLVETGDELAESVMGKYGRPELSGEESNFTLTNYENPEKPDGLPVFLKNIDNCFRNECTSLFPMDQDPEIHNIIQEILATIDKISYLLTLQK